MQLWNREQAILQLRWNVETVELDTTERFLYIKKILIKEFSFLEMNS